MQPGVLPGKDPLLACSHLITGKTGNQDGNVATMTPETDRLLICGIARQVFGNAFVVGSVDRISSGLVSTAYTLNREFVIRIGRNELALANFEKEQWCLEQARRLHITVPVSVATGQQEGTAFSIQKRFDGVPGTEIRSGYVEMWHCLGDYSSRLATVTLSRFGKHFRNDQVPALESWNDWVSGQLQYIFSDTGRIWRELFDRNSLARLRTRVNELSNVDATTVLAHGDMSEFNVLVGPSGNCCLIDWGDAGGFPRYWDLAQVCAWHEPGHSSIRAFCQGNGIGADQFLELQPWLERVQTWRWLSSIRWLMDQPNWMEKDFVRLSLNRLRLVLSDS